MPRKSSTAAAKDYLLADYDRWRVLARNRDFRKDLADYLNACGPNLSSEWRKSPVLSRNLLKKFERLKKQFLERWGIERVPDPALWQEDEPLIAPEGLERWYQAERKERADFTTGTSYPAYMTNVRRGSRHKEMFIEFFLDVSIPVDRLLAYMDKEVRAWYWKNIREHPRGKPASLDFHLKVFDLSHSLVDGKRWTFQDIARKLGRTPSSIRDAYVAACRKIGLSSHNQASAAEGLHHPGDVGKCSDSKCRNAETVEDFCPAHRAYLAKDEGSQKDLLVPCLSAIEHARARKASGRGKDLTDGSSDD